ncbi:MAG: flagellar biosynthesis anti-sigma factor FlgM [Candidatus Thiodiazotropha sp. L084R]
MPYIAPYRSQLRPYNHAYAYRGLTAFATLSMAVSGGDRVDLTGDASKLQELEGRIADMPIVDAQKVEAVQQALATGSFTIDPQTAADKMLAMELSLP